jgi:hypothetical protein
MLSKQDWKEGDIVALSQKGRDNFLSWERAVVVRPAFAYGDGYGLSVRNRASKMVGILTSREVAGRWVVQTEVAKAPLTRLQKRVLDRLHAAPADDVSLGIHCMVSSATARSRISELRKLGYTVTRDKDGLYHVA